MQTRAELCHIDTLRCVVRVEAWVEEHLIGSSLGEAATAEEAEDRAMARLRSRWPGENTGSSTPAAPVDKRSIVRSSENISAESQLKPDLQVAEEAPAQPKATSEAKPTSEQSIVPSESPKLPSETPTDPEDWSEELTAIDLEIKRIGWTREQEQSYLTRAFGHGRRHKLTRYADLVGYLRQLRLMQAGETPDQAPVPIRRGDLIQQGDQMLNMLKWTSEEARGFLQKQMNASSRQQLSDEQLLEFNMLLEEKMIK